MQERVLVIDDDDGMARLMRLQLERAGYAVQTAACGAAGLRLAQEWQPHLILLDILMPDMHGWMVYQELRKFTDAPVCFITALGEDQHVFQGLDLGADDYIVKPFSYKELLTRVRAALHRSRRAAQEPPLEIGPVRVDPRTHRVWRKGRPIHLTPTEFRLLLALARQAGQVVSREELVRQVWGSDYEGKRESLKLYILYLRRKLEDDPTRPRLLVSKRGVGYQLVAPDDEESQ
ncbi:MAG TPA: response regulator transcription factor [Anaerolineales bacterium]|nr:response regulator transcription factor [Anaerolineae bacterium]HIQ02016.1 response regulator transcription factor [Anaerolineales bacterium]